MPHSATPTDLAITPVDLRFERGAPQARWWLGSDPVATAFFNGLSVTFPKGEAFFIDSVRAFRDGAEPALAAAIAAFIQQEVTHSREHLAFNRRVVDAGYDVSTLDQAVDARLAFIRTKPRIAALAATMALEHFTAIFAHELLANPRHLAGAPDDARTLWQWHAIEEIQHKGVAYDTWLHATRDWSRGRRWWVKAKVMLLVTHNFLADRAQGMIALLRQDGLAGPGLWARMIWYSFVRPGMMRRIMAAWTHYFMPGFHPWQHDDRALIERAMAGLPASVRTAG